MHVADQPAPVHVAHDVFDRGERLRRRGLVVHRQEDAGDQLIHQHQQRQRSEVVPEVEVLRRVVLGNLALPQCGQRKALIDPADQALAVPVRIQVLRPSLNLVDAIKLTWESRRSPITMRASPANVYGGNREVLRRRHALEHAARNVELRAVARAIEPARPVLPQIGARHLKRVVRLERAERRAAEMRAHRQAHPVLGIARARRPRILDVGRLQRIVRVRIGEQVVVVAESPRATALLRRTTNTGWPRQTTFSIWPSSSFEASTATGAPSAFARSLGSHDAMNGTAAKATPTAPTPAVAAVSKRRRPWSTCSSLIRCRPRVLVCDLRSANC